MRFHRALRKTCYVGNLVYGIAVQQLQGDACTLRRIEPSESVVKVHPEAWVAVVGSSTAAADLSFAAAAFVVSAPWRVDVDRRLAVPQVVVVHIVGYTEQPCREIGKPAKLLQVDIRLYERLLREVVAQLFVPHRLIEEEPSHGRLVFHNKAIERLFVVKHSHLCYERDVADVGHGLAVSYII